MTLETFKIKSSDKLYKQIHIRHLCNIIIWAFHGDGHQRWLYSNHNLIIMTLGVMIKPLYRRNNRAAVTANPQSAPISRNRSVKTVGWKIVSVMKWHDFIRHLRTKNGLKGEWEQLHMALWLLIFVLCSRFSRNLPTFHKTCNPQIRTQWSKWARSFSIYVWFLWADINPVARRWPPSASERCSVTAARMKHVPLLIHSHVHSSAATVTERETVCMMCCNATSLFSITWCWN